MECANQGKQYRNTQLDSKQQDADRKTAEHLDTHRRDDEGRTGTAAVEHHPLGISWVDFLLLEQRSDGFGAHRIPADHPSSRMLPSSGGRKNSLRVTQARGRERKRYSPLLMRKQVNTIKQNSEGMTVCKHSRIPCTAPFATTGAFWMSRTAHSRQSRQSRERAIFWMDFMVLHLSCFFIGEGYRATFPS